MQLTGETIAGVVILYNPPDNVVANINSYIQHIAILYVVDNSESTSPELTDKLSNNKKIFYIGNNKNLGVARALNIGAEKAIQDGYKWLLTMDQDSKFEDGALFSCFNYLKDLSLIAIISPYHFEHSIANQKDLYDYQEADIVMTSGNLLNLSLFQQIGGFEDKLFIDEVDHDYCLKARMKGFKIIVFKNIVLNHQLGIFKEVIWKGKKEYISIHSAKRVYYLTRNNLYLIKTYRRYYPEVIKNRVRNFMVLCRNILLFEDDKLSKVFSIIKGCFDFLIGRYGK